MFVDRADLKAGESCHQPLHQPIAMADRFILLVSPGSVVPGSYALTQMGLAQQRWRRPAGRPRPTGHDHADADGNHKELEALRNDLRTAGRTGRLSQATDLQLTRLGR